MGIKKTLELIRQFTLCTLCSRSRRKALKRRKKKMMHGGSVVMDWDQIVRHLTVSSNESLSYRLIDGSHSTYWQSSGPQGKVLAEGMMAS